MADFRIRLTTTIDEGKSSSELETLKAKLEKKPIKLKVDFSDFNTQLKTISNTMKNAFKLDSKQLSNLNTLKTTLQEINKLSKQAQKSIFGNSAGSSAKGQVVEVKNLAREYDRLLAKQRSIEKQMSKTYNKQSYSAMAQELTKVRTQAESVGKALDKIGATKGTNNLVGSLSNTFQSIQKQIDTTSNKINNLFKNKNLGKDQAVELAKLKQELTSLQNISLDRILKADKPYAEMSKLVRGASELKMALSSLDINIKFNDQIEKSKSSIDGLISKLQTLNKSGFANNSGISNTISQLERLKSELSNINPNSSNAKAQFTEIANEINRCENEYKQFNSAMQSNKANFNFQTNLSRTLSELQQLRQKCVDLGQSTGQVDRLEQELRQLGSVSTDKAASGLQRIKSEMATMKSSMSGLSTAGSGVQKMFGNLYSTMTTFSLGNMLAMQIQRGVYSIGTTITELDTAFVSLQKVAPDSFRGTTQQLDDLRNKAINTGQEVARSSVDIINSTSSALQAGFKNIDGALEYAKNVNMYANVADVSEEDADKYIKSIMSAYGGVENSIKPMRTEIQGASKDYSLLNSYMDNANYIGNNYALTSGDIGEALSRSASTLKGYGVGIADSMALVAGAQESIQNAPKVGNAIKSLAINLGGMKTSAQDGSIELNKTAMALEKYANIKVAKPNGELMDTMDILTELSKKWDGFNQQTQAGLGEAIAGKYHSNVFSAMMSNFQTVKDIQDEIANGQAIGSADKENKRFIDSIQGRVVKLKEELKKLTTTTISTDMAKGFVSGLTSMVSGINNVISAFDKLGVATPVVLSGLTGMFMTIKSLGTGTQLPNFFKTISNLATSGSSLNKIQNNLKNTSTQFTNLSRTSSKFSGVMRATQGASNQMSKALQTNRVVATQTANGYSLMTKSASQAKSTLSGMGSTLQGIGSTLLTTFGNMAIMAVAGMAISKITEELYKFAHASEISMEAHEENISKINTKISELKTQKSGLKSIAKEYDELANKTNRSAKEQERYNELRNEIGELAPDLVAGVDGDNNAILSLNGSLKNYIKSLDSAIQKQRELLMQQQNSEASDASDYLQKGGNVAFGYDYRNYEKSTKVAKEEKSKIAKSGAEVTNAINRFTADSEGSFDSSIKRIQTARENHTAQIEESYNKVVEEQEKINEYSSKLKQKALNKVESNSKIKQADDKIKSFAKNITASLDFSSLKTGQIDAFARNLSNALGDGEIDGVLLKYQNLREEFERTGNTFAYENGIKSLIPEMSNLLGLNEDIVESMLKLDPTFTQATSSLDAYLQSFGKRESMRGFDTETESLAKQYETFSTMMDDLGNLDASNSVNGEVVFDVEAVAQIVNKEDVPKQVQDLFSEMQSDGKFTDEEMKIMMKISAGITSESSEERSQLLGQAQQLIDELFPDSKIDIGQLDIEAEYQLNEDSKKELAKQINELGDKGFVAKLKANIDIENFDQVQMYKDAISNLGGDKKDIQTFISANIKNFGDMTSYEEIVNWLLEHPDVANKYNISVVGADTVDAVAKKVNKLDLSKKEKKKIMVEVQEGDIPGLLGELDKLPPEKKVKVLSEISQALSGIDTVEARTLNKKFTDLLAIDNATGKINYVDEYKKLMNKNVEINADDNASSVINKLDLSTVVKWVQIKAQKIGDFFAGGYQPPVVKSTGGFSNVSDTPQQASTMSSGFSGISDSPTASASSPTPTASIQTGVSGQVSAKSTGSFGSVLTSSTLATKISTSYKNVWNMIKYGINLFQELENRISRTQNQIDLLGSKMENSIGTKKISYLQTQNKLYAEQAKLQKTLFNSLNKEKSSVSKKLKGLGFTINKQGNLTSYEEKLLKLEQAAEKAEKKSSGYKGKSDKTKKSLEKSADKAKQKLDDAKKLTEEYLKLQNTEIPNAEQKWYELQNAIKETNNEIEQLNFENKIYKEKNAIDRLNDSVKQYNHYRERWSTRAERSEGETKIKYLKEEAKHLSVLQKTNKKLHDVYMDQRKDYKSKLSSYGVKFGESGQISNSFDILNKYQNSSDLDKVKKWMEEYQDILDLERDSNDLTEEYINDMQDLQNEIKKLELDSSLKPFSTSVEVANSKIKKLQNNLDIINIKMEHAYGNDKLNLIKEQIKLYEQLDKEQKTTLENMKKQEDILKKELENNGFKFDSNGDITNMKDALSKIEKSGAYEYLKEVLEQWRNLHENEIPDANKSVEDFQKSIQDAYKSQLETTKEIEDKMTEMYKKQKEDKIKAIEKETDAVKKSIDEQKKAYNDLRKEAEYKNDYDEKSKNVSDLEKQLERAKKDTSLGNKKNIADLEKELEDAKKEFDKLVQDKMDEDINDMYDDMTDKVDKENQDKIDKIEEEWSDSKIAEMIKNALETGIFEDIDGNISNLQDAMLKFANSSGEAFSVMGKLLDEELTTKLNIALNTLKDYSDIYSNIMGDMKPPNFNANLEGKSTAKSISMGDININIPVTNGDPKDIGKEVKRVVNDEFKKLTQGL